MEYILTPPQSSLSHTVYTLLFVFLLALPVNSISCLKRNWSNTSVSHPSCSQFLPLPPVHCLVLPRIYRTLLKTWNMSSQISVTPLSWSNLTFYLIQPCSDLFLIDSLNHMNQIKSTLCYYLISVVTTHLSLSLSLSLFTSFYFSPLYVPFGLSWVNISLLLSLLRFRLHWEPRGRTYQHSYGPDKWPYHL